MTMLRIADSVISREIGGSLVVLDVERRAYFQLDRTAAAMWRFIETLARVDRVVAACASSFARESAAVERDLREFVADAAGWGLVVEGSGEKGVTPPAPHGDAPALSVDRSGLRIAGDLEDLKRQFVERPYLALPTFVAPALLSVVQRAIEQGDFAERAHPGIGTELCLESGAATSACQLVFNDPALLDAVTRITGCAALGCFDGRVYRMEPQSGHYDSWHSDASHDRMVGLSVNLSHEPYDGGVLEIRRAAVPEAEHAVGSGGPGSAVLFRISPELRHRVTAVRGGRPRTAYAGWFRTAPDFAAAFLSALDAKAVTGTT
jgi:Coenzyme PQQ synthesis protein D (PqqD)/2OG-Fe(II) oxygenase superfamily